MDGLLRAVIPAPSINKPRMNMPAFKAMTWMAKKPMTRLMTPQTMPRTAALRMVLRAQTTSRAWFWAESKTGWCDMDAGLEQTECRKGIEQGVRFGETPKSEPDWHCARRFRSRRRATRQGPASERLSYRPSYLTITA